MSAVSLLSSLREKPSEEAPKDVSDGEGIEEESLTPGGGVIGGGGGGDPAVLAVGAARRLLVYSRDELMRLRNSPLCRRPLDPQLLANDALGLVLKRRSDSPNEEDRGARGDAPNENHKGVYRAGERPDRSDRDRGDRNDRDRPNRSLDPRERVRKESEPSIVLSPQRRSFTSGCGAPHVPAHKPHKDRAESPQPPAPPAKQEHGAGRRIGSGRIMVREAAPGWEDDWDYRHKDNTHNNRPNNDRYERRSFNRDSYSSDMKRERDERFNNNNEKNRDREDNRREDNRRSGGRYRRYDNNEEPEWFSGGPTSKLETIELRGFDEPAKKNGPTNNKDEKWSRNDEGGSKSPERWREQASPRPAQEDSNTSNDKDSGVESKPEESGNEQPDFNLDEFLKFDAIPDVLTNGTGESEGGSRFSRWFHRESPTNERHYERLLHNIVDEIDTMSVNAFTPLRPDDFAHHRQEEANSGGGKIHSLEELEARLRPQHSAQHKSDHDLSAFKRLLAQVSGGHAVPAEQRAPAHQQPMTLLQMLNKSMEQTQQQQQQPPPKPPAPSAPQPHIPQDLLYKLLQVQQRQAAQPAQPAQPQMPQNEPHANDRDLLQRPEAQAIIHGLKAGEITVQHLMQQLGNPGLQSRHRELLLTILRLHQQHQQMGGSPLGGAPSVPVGMASHLVVPHHQPLRLSPLPHPGVPARIPSPRELAAHTQSIMQGALIKKKLEEQRENYRRRHELHKQAPPISFTPTSVLRKMTAEKESEAPSPKLPQWSQPTKMPQGRPIVKGNQSGAAPMGYAPSPNDYQQHYLNQQQQMAAGVRSFSHPQPRQQAPSFNNMNNMTRGIPGGTTLHQLLVQSHQRSLNEMGGNASGGGDNQLARWFSPELLARASAGKLPSVHVPNALSLEDLERHHHSPAPPVRN